MDILNEGEKSLRAEYRKAVIESLRNSSTEKYPRVDDLFEDVYHQLTPNLIEQSNQLKEHLKKYGSHYPLDKYEN